MIVNPASDVTAMRIHLNELRSKFDQAMRDGESFTSIKEIHLQIKELESCIKVLEWNSSRGDSVPRIFDERRYSYVDEPRPLL